MKYCVAGLISIWSLWLLAIVSMINGNPTAINAVIGIPVPTGIATWAVVDWYRVRKTLTRQ